MELTTEFANAVFELDKEAAFEQFLRRFARERRFRMVPKEETLL